MIITLDREYPVKCTLGTIRDVERKFGCSFTEVLTRLGKMNADEQLKLLFCGVRRADPTAAEAEFLAAADEHLGFGELADKLEEFAYQLQYPGKTQEDIENIVSKKLAKAGQLKNSIGANSFAQAPAQD